ncbi:metallophosphoesterase family protein [Maliponia aquimaris]|uniref:Diadenosine tetraphosphatase n=1 Tax=Maliponia aquimaris TaxID=1673631 RepID=A0A238K9X6_9RHOB|nr:metallophosphoesterase family protein [Maliponia aquimaris]SMX39287.1 diadenosine tetraphosphatase [Maliponia aquimaris]
MDRIYAIGDIHGQKAMLEDALARVDRDGGGRVVFLGDYVDRGPDSAGVIDLLCSGIDAGQDWVCLKGNHDRMFEWFVVPPTPRVDPYLLVGYHWFHPNIGGIQTAESYGVAVPKQVRQKTLADDLRAAVPERHVHFLQDLKLSHREGGVFFVHAGVRPQVLLDQQDEEDLLWIRQDFHRYTGDFGAFIVHGHTPVDAPDLHPNRLNLDTGAGYGDPLSVAVFEGQEISILGPSGRVRLR